MTPSQPSKNASEDQASSEAVVPPSLAKYTRILLVVVVLLGLLLLVGFAVVVNTIMKRINASENADQAPRQGASPTHSAMRDDGIPLDLPEGAEVLSVTASDGLIIVQIGRKGASRLSDIISYDARTGRQVAHLRLP